MEAVRERTATRTRSRAIEAPPVVIMKPPAVQTMPPALATRAATATRQSASSYASEQTSLGNSGNESYSVRTDVCSSRHQEESCVVNEALFKMADFKQRVLEPCRELSESERQKWLQDEGPSCLPEELQTIRCIDKKLIPKEKTKVVRHRPQWLRFSKGPKNDELSEEKADVQTYNEQLEGAGGLEQPMMRMKIEPLRTEMLEIFENEKVEVNGEILQNLERILKFEDIGIVDEIFLRNLKDMKINNPTSVQRELIKHILNSDNDLLVHAISGCGKSLGYLIPLLHKAVIQSKEPSKTHGAYPRTIVVTHSGHFAHQVNQNVEQLMANIHSVSYKMVIGGENALKKLEGNCDFLICTLGKLNQLMKEGQISLKHLETLVFDDADGVMYSSENDISYVNTIKGIQKLTGGKNSKVRKVFTGAAYKTSVRESVNFLRPGQNTKIFVGDKDFPIPTIEQNIIKVEGPGPKREKFVELLPFILHHRQTIVFAKQDSHVMLSKCITSAIPTLYESTVVVKDERDLIQAINGNANFVISTPDSLRGLNMPHADTIVIFDFPVHFNGYIDCLGRCANKADKAVSYIFVDKENDKDRALLLEHSLAKQEKLAKQRELADEHGQILHQLNGIQEELINAQKLEDPQEKSAKILELHQHLQPINQTIDSLVNDIQLQSENLVQLTANPSTLQNYIKDLEQHLMALESDAQRQLQLVKVENEVSQKSQQLIDQIKDAEKLLANPDASIEELKKSNEILLTAQPKLDEISKLYEDLKPEDELAQELRNKTADQLSKLNELFQNNQQSAKDRIDLIVAQRQQELADLINLAQNSLQNPTAKPEDFEENNKKMSTMIHDLESTKPTQNQQVENLTRLIEMAKEANERVKERADLWTKFKALRDKINDRQDLSRVPIEQVKNKALWEVSEANNAASFLENSRQQLNPIRTYIEQLSEIAQQLDPLEIAESEIRFLKVDQDDLEADYQELIGLIKTEADDEQQINTAINSLINQIRQILSEMPDFDRNDLALIQHEAIPSIQKQLDEINARDQDAKQNRQVINRQWPSDTTNSQNARHLINQIIAQEVDCLKKINDKEVQEQLFNEWLLKRQELDHQLIEVTTTTKELLNRNADNLEPKSVQSAKDDVQGISNLSEKLRRAKEMLQTSIDWLMQSELPDEERNAALLKLSEKKTKIDNEEARLKSLEENLTDKLNKQQELDGRRLELTQKLNAIADEIQQAHQNSDPEVRKQQLESIQQKTQPLKQEIEDLHRQSDLQPQLFLASDSTDNINNLIKQVDMLESTLESDQQNAQRQLQLVKVENKVSEQSQQLIDQIKDAEKLLSNPDASIEELRKSNKILLKAQPKLDEISKLYEDLKPEDELAQELRNKTADQLSKLNELFKNNQQSTQDRINLIVTQCQRELNIPPKHKYALSLVEVALKSVRVFNLDGERLSSGEVQKEFSISKPVQELLINYDFFHTQSGGGYVTRPKRAATKPAPIESPVGNERKSWDSTFDESYGSIKSQKKSKNKSTKKSVKRVKHKLPTVEKDSLDGEPPVKSGRVIKFYEPIDLNKSLTSFGSPLEKKKKKKRSSKSKTSKPKFTDERLQALKQNHKLRRAGVVSGLLARQPDQYYFDELKKLPALTDKEIDDLYDARRKKQKKENAESRPQNSEKVKRYNARKNDPFKIKPGPAKTFEPALYEQWKQWIESRDNNWEHLSMPLKHRANVKKFEKLSKDQRLYFYELADKLINRVDSDIKPTNFYGSTKHVYNIIIWIPFLLGLADVKIINDPMSCIFPTKIPKQRNTGHVKRRQIQTRYKINKIQPFAQVLACLLNGPVKFTSSHRCNQQHCENSKHLKDEPQEINNARDECPAHKSKHCVLECKCNGYCVPNIKGSFVGCHKHKKDCTKGKDSSNAKKSSDWRPASNDIEVTANKENKSLEIKMSFVPKRVIINEKSYVLQEEEAELVKVTQHNAKFEPTRPQRNTSKTATKKIREKAKDPNF